MKLTLVQLKGLENLSDDELDDDNPFGADDGLDMVCCAIMFIQVHPRVSILVQKDR